MRAKSVMYPAQPTQAPSSVLNAGSVVISLASAQAPVCLLATMLYRYELIDDPSTDEFVSWAADGNR